MATSVVAVAVPFSFPAPKDPNGLAVDQHGTLYIADGQSGSVVRIGRDRRVVPLPIETDGVISSTPIGGIAVANDGSLFVTRHGYGGAGIVRVLPDGTAEDIAAMSPTSYRFGIAYDPLMHALYTTQYIKSLNGPAEGAVVEIDLDTRHATTLVVGFSQPVGIVRLGGNFVVTDARAKAVYRIDLREGRAEACTALAELERPGSICAHGRDSVLVTSYDDVSARGSIHELWMDGRTRTVASGTWQPSGIACDDDRVYLAARGIGRILEFHI